MSSGLLAPLLAPPGFSALRHLSPVSSLGSLFFFYLAVLGLSCTMHTLNCSMWDPVLWPGIEPWPLPWELGVLTTEPPGKSLKVTFKSKSWSPRPTHLAAEWTLSHCHLGVYAAGPKLTPIPSFSNWLHPMVPHLRWRQEGSGPKPLGLFASILAPTSNNHQRTTTVSTTEYLQCLKV